MNEIVMPPAGGEVGRPVGPDAIGVAVDAAAAGVAGVVSVYAARPLVARAAEHLGRGTTALSAVQLTPGGVEATVSVGVELGRDAGRVAEAVASRVRAVLVGMAVGDASVRVRVSRLVAVAPPTP